MGWVVEVCVSNVVITDDDVSVLRRGCALRTPHLEASLCPLQLRPLRGPCPGLGRGPQLLPDEGGQVVATEDRHMRPLEPILWFILGAARLGEHSRKEEVRGWWMGMRVLTYRIILMRLQLRLCLDDGDREGVLC